jgi:hypothetical protein
MVSQGHRESEPYRAMMERRGYLPEGGNTQLDLTELPYTKDRIGRLESANVAVVGEWMDIYSGKRLSADITPSGWNTLIENPFEDKSSPCALVINVV